MKPAPALIVDDDPLLTLALRRRLERNGCAVVVASSIEEALKAAETAEDWLMFLIDLCLPPDGATAGLDLLAILRRRWPDVPAALMTGVEDFGLLVPAARLSAQYIPKGNGAALVAFLNLIRPPVPTPLDRLFAEAENLGLTPRELDVTLSTARQEDVRTFCEKHGMKPRTLRHHAANVVAKTGARSVLGFLVRLAYRGATAEREPEE